MPDTWYPDDYHPDWSKYWTQGSSLWLIFAFSEWFSSSGKKTGTLWCNITVRLFKTKHNNLAFRWWLEKWTFNNQMFLTIWILDLSGTWIMTVDKFWNCSNKNWKINLPQKCKSFFLLSRVELKMGNIFGHKIQNTLYVWICFTAYPITLGDYIGQKKIIEKLSLSAK